MIVLVDNELPKEIAKKEGVEVVYWTASDVPTGTFSVPRLFESQHGKFLEQLLSWIYDLSSSSVGEISLKEHLLSHYGDLSLWACSLLNEKSCYKTNSFYFTLKLAALEQFLKERPQQELQYVGHSRILHKILKRSCAISGRNYHWNCRVATTGAEIPVASTKLQRLPHSFQAFVFWLQKMCHVFVRQHSLPQKKSATSQQTISIVTYFPNIDAEKAKQGIFYSRYWESLHYLFDNLLKEKNWFWLYVGGGQFDRQESQQLLKICNQTAKSQDKKEQYFFCEDYLTGKSFFRALSEWFRFRSKALFWNHLRERFCFSCSTFNFYEVFQEDWKSSLYGKVMMENLLWVEQFHQLAKTIANNNSSLYLWEGQPWEYALVAALRRHGHKKIMGYQHSAIRPMDLRIFHDRRVFKEPQYFPFPDVLLTGGQAAEKLLLQIGFPNEKLRVVEATRYFGLQETKTSLSANTKVSGKTLLVLCGYRTEETRFQLQLLNKAAESGALKEYTKILVQGHPFTPVNPILEKIRPVFLAEIISDSLVSLLQKADVVYCANSTTAFLEVIWAHLPVIAAGPSDAINLNPLFGYPGYHFVNSGEELAKLLKNPPPTEIPENYFDLNRELPKWKSVLLEA